MKIENWIVQSYLFLMFGIFPLYYQDGYYNMGDAKYEFFKFVTIALFIVMGLWLLFEKLQTIGKSKKDRKTLNISVQDWSVLIYFSIALVAWIISPYRKEAWVGSHEWYMGLLSQILFVGIYFMISRYMSDKSWTLIAMGISATIVFFISYLHRFRMDPLGLYEGVAEKYWLSFLGTIGNANWYSSYICVILPIMMGVYIFYESRQSAEGKWGHVLNAGLILLGFATTVTQNSDSAYIGLALGILFLMWFALESLVYFRRFLEILLLGLCVAKITGYLQVAFPKKAMILSEISTEITQGNITKYVLGIVLFLYVIVLIGKKRVAVIWENIKKIRNVFYIVLGIMILLVPMLMWLVSTGKISLKTGLLSETGYLIFNDKWGTNRGKIWKYAVQIYKEYPLSMKLFGCGPDSLMYYTNEFHQAKALSFGKNEILTNVHNEWLNMLINYGILGAFAYCSIFIVNVVHVSKYWKSKPILLAFGASVLAYIGHNFFCFQQVVCTSLIFIVIAMVEWMIRD